MDRFRRESGNTLISLLVTAGIIAVLAAIALPVMNRLTANRHLAGCISNLRQIGMAVHLYANDHNGDLPPTRTTKKYRTDENPAGVHHQDYLKNYLDPDFSTKDSPVTAKKAGVFWCPADYKRKNSLAYHSYGVNYYLGDEEERRARYFVLNRDLDKRLYLIDCRRSNNSTVTFSHNTWPFDGGAEDANVDSGVDFRHGGRANALFLDGHVISINYKELVGKDPRKLITIPYP